MKTYKIIESTYFDDYGVEKHQNFFIKELKTFWTIDYWRRITHLECGMSDCCQATTTFKTEDEAAIFIQDILCLGKPIDGWKNKVVNEYTCK